MNRKRSSSVGQWGNIFGGFFDGFCAVFLRWFGLVEIWCFFLCVIFSDWVWIFAGSLMMRCWFWLPRVRFVRDERQFGIRFSFVCSMKLTSAFLYWWSICFRVGNCIGIWWWCWLLIILCWWFCVFCSARCFASRPIRISFWPFEFKLCVF